MRRRLRPASTAETGGAGLTVDGIICHAATCLPPLLPLPADMSHHPTRPEAQQTQEARPPPAPAAPPWQPQPQRPAGLAPFAAGGCGSNHGSNGAKAGNSTEDLLAALGADQSPQHVSPPPPRPHR